jgi:hypothetical protein
MLIRYYIISKRNNEEQKEQLLFLEEMSLKEPLRLNVKKKKKINDLIKL